MSFNRKENLMTADFKKISLKFYIFVPITLSVILIIFSDMSEAAIRLLNCISLVSAILALASPLVSNQDQACRRIDEHMSLGNSYLALHKEIRNLAAGSDVTTEQLVEITKKMEGLDRQSRSLHISFIGRLWSKCTINKEMDLKWIKAK
jgi:hypothetical protein